MNVSNTFLTIFRIAFPCIVVTLVSIQQALCVEGWLNWRGPHQNGVSNETGLPDKWEPGGENHLWTYDLPGRGSPVVAGDRVYAWGYEGEGPDLREYLVCLDADTGEEIWKHGFNDFISDIVYDRYTIGSPTVDPETGNIYLLTTPGLMNCFTPDGELVWQISIMERFGRLTFPNGRTGAPVIEGEKVIINVINSFWGAEGPARNRFLAFDKHNGDLIWSSTPGIGPKDSSFSTPVFAYEGNTRVFYAGTGCGNVVCVNANTGEPIWRFQLSQGGVNSSVVVHDDHVIAVHGKENVDSTEVGRMVAIKRGAKPEQGEQGPKVLDYSYEKWRQEMIMFTSSPVIVGDRIYQTVLQGDLLCIDANTGEILWKEKLANEQLHASPLYADGKLYVPMVDGDFYIIKPTDEKAEILHHVNVGANLIGSPVVWDGKIYLHAMNGLHCFGTAAEDAGGETTQTAQVDEGFEPLFDSWDNDGWNIQGLEKAGPEVIEEEGEKVLKVGGWDYWAVISKKEFENFILRFDVKFDSRGNSGVLLHTPPKKEVFKKENRLEIQLESGDDSKINSPESKNGAIERFAAPAADPAKPIGEWNRVEIKYLNGHVWVKINDTVVQDGVDISQFDELKDHPNTGHIALQRNDFKKAVYFKNLRIKEISENQSGEETKDAAAGYDQTPSSLQVVPADVLITPGETKAFRYRVMDQFGAPMGKLQAADDLAFEPFIPPTAKVRTQMDAAFNSDGKLVAKADAEISAGAFKATHDDGLVGFTRGRLLPQTPIREDFEEFELTETNPDMNKKFSYPPLPWIGARFKWEIQEKDGNNVLVKTLDNVLFQRALTFIGHPDTSDYTIQADVMTDGDRRMKSNVGVICQRYIIALIGNKRTLEVSSNYNRIVESVPYSWKEDEWHTVKAHVEVKPDGSGLVQAKAWPQGTAEPDEWMIEVPHKNANQEGVPGIFGFSPQSRYSVYVDNVMVTSNQ